MVQYYDCSSERVSYSSLGIATVTYTIISDNPTPEISSTFSSGSMSFTGVVMSYLTQIIPKSEHSSSGGWYTTNVTLMALT